MSMLKKLGYLCVCLVSLSWVNVVNAATDQIEDGADVVRLVLGDREAKVYQPFTVSEMQTLADSDPDDDLSTREADGKTYLDIKLEGNPSSPFTMEIADYVAVANQLEETVTPYGYSLRDDSFDALPIDIYELFQDPDKMQARLLNALELYAKEELMRRLDAIDPGQCPQIDVDKLAAKFNGKVDDLSGQYSLLKDKRLRLKSGDLVRFDEYIRTTNNTSKILCALGYNIYAAMGLKIKIDPNGFKFVDLDSLMGAYDPQGLLTFLDDKWSLSFKSLGLSIPGSESILSWAPLQKMMDWSSALVDIEGLDIKLKLPSAEFLKATIADLGLDIPENLNLPDLPNISFNKSFTPPTREELVLKKRKDWQGFDLGSHKIAAATASAYYEIRGSEKQQWAVAVGRADVIVFNKTNNAIGAYAQAEVGPELLQASTDIQVLGMQLYQHEWKTEGKTMTMSTELLGSGDGYSYSYAYTQQFAIGPIPVYVSLGVYASANAVLNTGLAYTQVYVELMPSAKAGAFGEGAVGIKSVLSAGVQGKIDVLTLAVPLRGQAGLYFSDNGEPYLKLGLTSDANVAAMSGGISVFVEYPWIKICHTGGWIHIPYPCIKKRRSSKTLYSYNGYRWSKSIMNWGLTYGYQGVQISGAMIDQTDRNEAAALAGKIDLYQRQVALDDYSSQTELRIKSAFDTFKVLLNDDDTMLLPQKQAALALNAKASNDNVAQYESWLLSTIENNSESAVATESQMLNTSQWQSDTSSDSSLSSSSVSDNSTDNSNVLRSLHGFL